MFEFCCESWPIYPRNGRPSMWTLLRLNNEIWRKLGNLTITYLDTDFYSDTHAAGNISVLECTYCVAAWPCEARIYFGAFLDRTNSSVSARYACIIGDGDRRLRTSQSVVWRTRLSIRRVELMPVFGHYGIWTGTYGGAALSRASAVARATRALFLILL